MAGMVEDRRVPSSRASLSDVPIERLQGRRERSNLPAPLTSFVGRRGEVTKLVARLAETRLLTLTGIGGIGKSRLALEVARVVLDQSPGEVWSVELAGIADPGHIAGAVAAVLGVRDNGERPLAETLADSVGDRQMLLVLDNCEHLAEATAELVLGLLQRCPNLRVLATSRVPLRLSGETDWPVAPLAVPDIDRLPARSALTRYAAVRLLVDRGRAARPDFALTEQNAVDVVRICTRLDGLPLAIELAAARLKVLAPAEILAGLDDRFTLLVGNDRASLPRHRTLRATLDWSYGLLGEPERALLRHLAPFVGGWSVHTLEHVGSQQGTIGGDPPEAISSPPIGADPSPLQILTRLVEHSLVVVETRNTLTRFRFLETVQRYAEGHLEQSGEAAAARGRHLLALLDLAGRARAGIVTSEQQAWCDRLDAEIDNIRAAVAWACEAPLTPVAGPPGVDTALEAALRLAGAVYLLYLGEIRGQTVEARVSLERLLALDRLTAVAGQQPGLGRVAALNAHGYAAFMLLDAPAAQASLVEAAALARAAGERFEELFALSCLGSVSLMLGDLDRAAALCDAAIGLARRAGVPFGLGGTLYWRGEVALAAGDRQQARALFEESLGVARQYDLPREGSATLGGLAKLAMHERAYDEAAAMLGECVATFHALGDPRGVAWALDQLAWALAAVGQARQAALLLGAAANLFRRLGTPRPPFPQWLADRERAQATARAALGDAAFEAAYAEGQALSVDRAVALALSHGAARLAPAPVLSRRASEIAQLVARGLSNRQIADELVLQERTVANHLQRIYTRLGVHGRVQLAAWVLAGGLGRSRPA